ncbi:hypothetical protein PC9H_009329 [Pleurotus ostreatus]|uniref:Uncharacterized protein n=1 Tax=Pleurotus ostreatus TaxID=5322 RepID=A0A8H7DMU5_PLEOS|nr:uncharacterized protein PC9H_009329 [Pleurotus ostreatus]KAF7424029.1 hypothetical protein PC9H_009329 [Pleurotus ostreatus]KAJ8693155.1 hypothetical protein PTI98_010397 [Pleurotus ostreatus]
MPQEQVEERQPVANGHHTNEQPAASQHMNAHAPPKPGNPKKSNMDAYSEGVMKEAGKQTVDYGVENHDELADKGEETYEDTKLKVQGWWQKNCGCLGGSV